MAERGIDIAYVAELARIELAPEKAAELQKELETIVAYVAELSEVDVEGVEPTAHAGVSSNVWREDEVVPSFPREAMLANAPGLVDDHLIKLPPVLPGGES